MTIRIKFDINIMKFISMFESITHASVKDCIEDDNKKLIFIVKQGDIAKAIGKKGANIKRIEQLLKKKVKVIEYNPDLLEFIKNVVAPLKVADIVEEEGIITITPPDSKIRGFLIGRGADNLRGFEKIIKRYFDFEELKVV